MFKEFCTLHKLPYQLLPDTQVNMLAASLRGKDQAKWQPISEVLGTSSLRWLCQPHRLTHYKMCV